MTALGSILSTVQMVQGGYELVEQIIISGAGVTTKDFATVLDGDNDGGYIMEFNIINTVASANNYGFRINGASGAATSQRLSGKVSTVAASAVSTNLFAAHATSAGTGAEGIAILYFPVSRTGFKRYIIAASTKFGGTAEVDVLTNFFYVSTPTSATNITSLGLMSDTASAIGIGTVMRLYKLIPTS